MTSEVPPSIELARARMNMRCTVPEPSCALRPTHLVAVVEHALRTEQVDAEVVDALVELGVGELGGGSLGPGRARLGVGGAPGIGDALYFGLDPQAHQPVPGDGIPPGRGRWFQRWTAVPIGPPPMGRRLRRWRPARSSG